MKYQIVYFQRIEDLEENVQGFVDEGWRPCGGVTAATDVYTNRDGGVESTTTFAQAMTRDAI